MLELMTEILVYLVIATLIGFLLGFVVWGWGRRRKIDAARAEGIASVRTSMDGDSSLKTQLQDCERERKRLELALDRSKDKVAKLQAELDESKRHDDGVDNAVDNKPADDPKTDDSDNDAQTMLDADIDFDIEGQTDDGDVATRPLFAGGRDVDPRISGLDPDEAETGDAGAPVMAPASLLTERPDQVDDLKEIKGVGKVMESVLNGKGVYLFHQIANFSANDVAWVNEAIEAFPGRIERDNWVGQAQELYRTKYGRSHED